MEHHTGSQAVGHGRSIISACGTRGHDRVKAQTQSAAAEELPHER